MRVFSRKFSIILLPNSNIFKDFPVAEIAEPAIEPAEKRMPPRVFSQRVFSKVASDTAKLHQRQCNKITPRNMQHNGAFSVTAWG
jgi:hypothetical protein